MTSNPGVTVKTGVGLRLPHLSQVVATRPSAGWLEVHPENFLANPHAAELLVELSHHYPISVHTVGISIGSASGIDRAHLERVRGLIDLVNPFLVSGHLAWSTYGGEYLNDLLPLPYNDEVLRFVAGHIDQVQNVLARPYLIENPSSYVGFVGSTMDEVEFLNELVCRTGCKLLCDVSNVYLSAHNMGYDPFDYIDRLMPGAVAELHLGGFSPEEDQSNPGAEILIDTHATPITEPVWQLYAYAIGRFGLKPTLVEWDNDIPPLATLIDEARRADLTAARGLATEALHAVAR